jgi:hypothetical protein
MKAKNVKSVCNSKFRSWLKSIDDEAVRELAKNNTIITGGAIASMLLGEDVNDFDMYFRTKEATFAIATYYATQFSKNPPKRFKNGNPVQIYVEDLGDRVRVVVKSVGAISESSSNEYQYFEGVNPETGEASEYVAKILNIVQDAEEKDDKPPYRAVYLSANAITLKGRIQLVTRFFGEPDQIHENYDFAHCMNYWSSWDNRLCLRPESLEALLARELRYVGSKYPLCSIIRTRKFIERGWHVTAGQYLKMVMQLNAMDLSSVEVLEEQLTGVDTAYFNQVIDALRERDQSKVDTAYLVELIDSIF